jgi:hypothetical protein
LVEPAVSPVFSGLSPLKIISRKGNNIPRDTSEKIMERMINRM